jgi:hypothetical protein
VTVILIGLREMLNNCGYDLLNKMQQKYPQLEINYQTPLSKNDFTNQETCDYLPLTFDFFCKSFVFSYFGDLFIDQQFMVEFLQHFGDWLRTWQLTKIKTKLVFH